MQVGTGGSARSANQTNDLALFHCLSLTHERFAEMTVHGDQALAVIQKNSLAVVVQVIDERHLSSRWCANFGTGGCGNVQTAVRIARLAIEESAMTKQAAHPALKGLQEAVLWRLSVGERQVQGALPTALSPDTCELVWVWVDHFAVLERDVLLRIGLIVHLEAMRADLLTDFVSDFSHSQWLAERNPHQGFCTAYQHRAVIELRIGGPAGGDQR